MLAAIGKLEYHYKPCTDKRDNLIEACSNICPTSAMPFLYCVDVCLGVRQLSLRPGTVALMIQGVHT